MSSRKMVEETASCIRASLSMPPLQAGRRHSQSTPMIKSGWRKGGREGEREREREREGEGKEEGERERKRERE